MNTIDLIIVALTCGVLVRALTRYAPKGLRLTDLAAQGVLGVYTGLMVRAVKTESEEFSFDALGSSWPIVIAVAVGTLVICIAGGALLGRYRDISPLTGGLALVAGGSTGVVSMARELGADDRVVAAVQYFRVALITGAMPVVVAVFYQGTGAHGSSQISETGSLPWYFGLPMIAVIVVVGAVAGRSVRLPAAGLLGPMAIAIVMELSGLSAGLTVPMVLVQAGIMVIIWQTVFACNRESLRVIKRILPGAFALIIVLNVAVAGLGVVLANVAGLSMLDGYLATSPGGAYAVLGTAVASNSDVPFVVASQAIRVVLMLVAAPFVARLFMRYTPQSAPTRSASRELVPVASAATSSASRELLPVAA